MKLIYEFLGTFLFLFFISLIGARDAAMAVANNSDVLMAPIGIGIALMVVVYMGGHVSGAHYNPAVSLAVFLRGKMSAIDMLLYWVVQIAGGILAFYIGSIVRDDTMGIFPGGGYNANQVYLAEGIATFALAMVVLNVATTKANAGTGFYGLAIGGTIITALVAAGPISGGAFNPAIGIGATVVHATLGGGTWANLPFYVVGPLVGGALAGLIFRLVHKGTEDMPDSTA